MLIFGERRGRACWASMRGATTLIDLQQRSPIDSGAKPGLTSTFTAQTPLGLAGEIYAGVDLTVFADMLDHLARRDEADLADRAISP